MEPKVTEVILRGLTNVMQRIRSFDRHVSTKRVLFVSVACQLSTGMITYAYVPSDPKCILRNLHVVILRYSILL